MISTRSAAFADHPAAERARPGVVTRGSLYLALAPHGIAHSFGAVEYAQLGIVAVLAVGAAALPKFTKASADAPVVEG